MYTQSEVDRNLAQYLSPGEHSIAGMAFAGDDELVVPYKRKESTDWMYHAERNQDIRKQMMMSEWKLGYVTNRHRLFLGRWPFSPDLFPIASKTASMLSNWQLARHRYALQTLASYEEKITRTERTDADKFIAARFLLIYHKVIQTNSPHVVFALCNN